MIAPRAFACPFAQIYPTERLQEPGSTLLHLAGAPETGTTRVTYPFLSPCWSPGV